MRLSEHYASIQGEGPNVGKPTQFVRFGGCNLRCPGWPCDTQHAIDPKYRNEWVKLTPHELYDKISELYKSSGATNICLTGGEPFLQPNDDLEELMSLLQGSYRVEVFSNGTILYPHWAPRNWTFVMDWKLPGSGEPLIGIEVRWANLENLCHEMHHEFGHQAVKFVLKDRADFFAAYDVFREMERRDLEIYPFYGRVWDSAWTDAEMIHLVSQYKLPWRLNVQMHNYIWPAHERAR